MAGYRTEDLNGWEFKILRSATGRFRNPEVIRQVCAEEAKAGWELLEKFDDYRIRFKRRVDKRSLDPSLKQDAYRTSVGANLSPVVLAILGALILIAGVVLLLRNAVGFEPRFLVIGVLALLVVGLLAVVVAKRRLPR